VRYGDLTHASDWACAAVGNAGLISTYDGAIASFPRGIACVPIAIA